ncbi:MAG: hypothetical protein L3J19_01475 [Sulfurimonas sp.]|nr:hypothetical protein [Sulfurimonas sp.]
MKNIFVIFIILPTFIYAAYNPFFSDKNAPKPKAPEVKVVIQKAKPKPIPKRQNAKITYIGFIESKKGKFALVSFDEKNIVVRKNDSLYLDEQIFKVFKITSNFILLKDRYSRSQTIYFSSEIQRY